MAKQSPKGNRRKTRKLLQVGNTWANTFQNRVFMDGDAQYAADIADYAAERSQAQRRKPKLART